MQCGFVDEKKSVVRFQVSGAGVDFNIHLTLIGISMHCIADLIDVFAYICIM